MEAHPIDFVRAEAILSIHEAVCTERDMLRAENKRLRKLLRDANRGAERASKVNVLVTDKNLALLAENKLLRDYMRPCDLHAALAAMESDKPPAPPPTPDN